MWINHLSIASTRELSQSEECHRLFDSPTRGFWIWMGSVISSAKECKRTEEPVSGFQPPGIGSIYLLSFACLAVSCQRSQATERTHCAPVAALPEVLIHPKYQLQQWVSHFRPTLVVTSVRIYLTLVTKLSKSDVSNWTQSTHTTWDIIIKCMLMQRSELKNAHKK